MKKVIYILFFALAVILSFTACDREKMDNDTVELGEGSVNLASLKGCRLRFPLLLLSLVRPK